ncbi:MAG: hypothetical protein ACRBN8_15970 [Nannocystales bacterium]
MSQRGTPVEMSEFTPAALAKVLRSDIVARALRDRLKASLAEARRSIQRLGLPGSR